jgi:SWI/SNF-related matrix-associated actin-dependent regulator of chromatin subfamily A3
MTRIQRDQALDSFNEDGQVTVFLISIKSGGVGLNLTASNRVYIMEPYWNPAVEQQAIDRVHRLGQTKNVTTIRFLIRNSIEENMQRLQKYKTTLAQKALDEDRESKIGRNGTSTLAEKIESLSILFC